MIPNWASWLLVHSTGIVFFLLCLVSSGTLALGYISWNNHRKHKEEK